ncbi:MAG: PadR family transcriptional regulator [Defluviitaleaceae bacterium]|nr:PadR family transcriptional regulator [Defluviitaleaceae bacterium]
MFNFVVIGMVLHQPLTGYDIKKYVDISIGNFFKASHGQLYPALKKLTDKNYLTMEEQSQGGRIKKYYHATKLGKDAFMDWLSAPTDFNSSSDTIMVKIFFFGELPDEIRRQRLYECELFVQQNLHKLREIEEQFAHSIESDRDYFEIATLYYGIQNNLSTLRWLRHIKEKKPYSGFIQKEDK